LYSFYGLGYATDTLEVRNVVVIASLLFQLNEAVPMLGEKTNSIQLTNAATDPGSRKRPWVAPTLILESAENTAGKVFFFG
jgi:hypothetical protein